MTWGQQMRQFLSRLAIAASVLIAAASAVPAPASAQGIRPLVYVNNSVVTSYELDQRMRFVRLLGAPPQTPEQTERELIGERLKMQEAKRLGITVSPEALQAGLDEFAGRANMDTARFTAELEQGGVAFQTFRDFIEAGVAWREVVRGRIVGTITVTDAEIEQELRRQIETPIIDRVLLSELILPAPEGQENAAMAQATQIRNSVASQADFAAAARRFSASASAEQGGQLDWVALDNLPPSLRPILMGLQPGQMTQPLAVPGAVVLFLLRDTEGTLRPGAREQTLEYLTLRLPSLAAAQAVARDATGCDTLYSQVGPQAAAAVQRQTASQSQIPTLIATQLATLDDDEAAVVSTGAGADLVMLCSRQPALVAQMQAGVATTAQPDDGVEDALPAANALPDRATVRAAIFNRKANDQGEALLEDLRANAVIRRP